MPETLLPLDLSLQVDNEILLQDIADDHFEDDLESYINWNVEKGLGK